MAADLYESLKTSAQVALFEASDVALSRIAAEGLSRVLSAPRFSGTAFGEAVRVLEGLGCDLGSRIRLRLDTGRRGETYEFPGLAEWRARHG